MTVSTNRKLSFKSWTCSTFIQLFFIVFFNPYCVYGAERNVTQLYITFCLFLENTSSNRQITTNMASKAYRVERTEAFINSWRDEKSLWAVTSPINRN